MPKVAAKRARKGRRTGKGKQTTTDNATAGVRGNVGFSGAYRPARAPQPAPAGKYAYEDVCALTDPFCPAARDARWPDGVGNRTLTFQIRRSHVMPSDAQGEAAFFFRPEYPYNHTPGTSVGLVVTSPATWFASTSFPGVGLYRITSAGVRVMSNMTPMTEKGEIWIGTSPTSMSVSTAYDLGNPLVWTEIYTSSVKNGTVSEWVSTPNTPASRILIKPNGTGNTAHQDLDNSAWTECLIAAQFLEPNLPAALRVEIYMNMEYVADASGSNVFYSTLAPPMDLDIQQAAAICQRSKEASTRKVQSDHEGRDIAEKLAKMAITRVKSGARGFIKSGPRGAIRGLIGM